MARELNRQLQELQIQLKRNRAKIAEDAQQLEVVLLLMLFLELVLRMLWMPNGWRWCCCSWCCWC